MNYAFDIVGISPVLNFFNHQLERQDKEQKPGVEYIGSTTCTLDALLNSLESLPHKWEWDKDEITSTVISFWMNNSESICYWKSRLDDAGSDNLLIARLADVSALKQEFNLLLKKKN